MYCRGSYMCMKMPICDVGGAVCGESFARVYMSVHMLYAYVVMPCILV